MLSSGSSTELSIVSRSASSTKAWTIYSQSGRFTIFSQASGLDRLIIKSAGNVGIGTAAPSIKLHVNGTVTATTFSGAGTSLTGTASGLTAGLVTNGIYTTSKLSDLASTTSAELASIISDETGSGSLVFATSPTLVTPALGTPASGVLTNCTGTASGLTAGLVTNGIYTTNNLSALASTTSAELASIISDETGSGSLVFATSPTLVTPALGTPTSGDLSNYYWNR